MDLISWVQQLTPDRLPPVPWLLHPSVAVSDNAKFLASLQRDGQGRNRYGALGNDLAAVHRVVTTGEYQPAPWAGRFVIAAPDYKIERKTKKRGRRAA